MRSLIWTIACNLGILLLFKKKEKQTCDWLRESCQYTANSSPVSESVTTIYLALIQPSDGQFMREVPNNIQGQYPTLGGAMALENICQEQKYYLGVNNCSNSIV